ncbi:RidA family protein [Thiomonas bhubaneswarensis]|uniref:Enamine deaminase RidA, house cleaning of reactive enamine intermediates, YjgF/YER057c/UK114 family n=1 Tax=Thiomonas bhubaneswarensis TaxID=339866 RepID=A0A0K6I788_9BURK|nr:RidA family protein [Thiomonas bhubaneswarensis]CUA98999.1 Enamine deaminase RidA, house cleaning of reactive enamine intermediates, YjgF/YER057c/UK114 family [Thiomonas bhubaneswarensis]
MIERLHVGPRLSEAAICAGTVYLAGQVPELHPDADLEDQTREVLGHIDRLLHECGSSKAHLLSVQIFLANIADIGRMNAVWDAWMAPGHAPPRATVQAALADPRWRLEIVVVARQMVVPSAS